jgi:hypothetical protein
LRKGPGTGRRATWLLAYYLWKKCRDRNQCTGWYRKRERERERW